MAASDYPADWEDRRKNVLRRDKYECRACGISDENAKQEYDRGLHAHHINPISEGGGHELDNLVALCEECHVRVHANQEEVPYEPISVYNCAECNEPYFDGEGYAGSFCCSMCWARFKARSALNGVHTDKTICSTCFARVHSDADSCPECGNWELNTERRSEINVEELDIEYLLMYVIYQRARNRNNQNA